MSYDRNPRVEIFSLQDVEISSNMYIEIFWTCQYLAVDRHKKREVDINYGDSNMRQLN